MDNYNGNNNGFNDVSENRAQNEPVQPQTGDRQIVYYTRPHQYIPEPPKNQKPKRNGYKIAFFSTIGVLAAACLIYVFVAGFNLINSYNEKREAKLAEYQDKQPTKEEIEAVNEYLQTEFNKIMENDIIREYVKASRVFEMLLTQMDNIIKQGVAVDDGHSGCSGSCSTCSGCH